MDNIRCNLRWSTQIIHYRYAIEVPIVNQSMPSNGLSTPPLANHYGQYSLEGNVDDAEVLKDFCSIQAPFKEDTSQITVILTLLEVMSHSPHSETLSWGYDTTFRNVSIKWESILYFEPCFKGVQIGLSNKKSIRVFGKPFTILSTSRSGARWGEILLSACALLGLYSCLNPSTNPGLRAYARGYDDL